MKVWTLVLALGALASGCGRDSDSVSSTKGSYDLMNCGYGDQERQDNPGMYASEQEIFRLINEFRASNGLYPYKMHGCLNVQAIGHSKNMARQLNASHVLDGLNVIGRLDRDGLPYVYGAENIHYWSEGNGAPVWNFSAYPSRAMGFWTTSPGHRAALLNNTVQWIGVGVGKATSGSYGNIYGTLVFVQEN